MKEDHRMQGWVPPVAAVAFRGKRRMNKVASDVVLVHGAFPSECAARQSRAPNPSSACLPVFM
jgi:hypothetical protein